MKTNGGYALQNYSLSHRDSVWEKLVWRNRIVSPVVAVQNLHRFFELDIDATMRTLLEYVFNDLIVVMIITVF